MSDGTSIEELVEQYLELYRAGNAPEIADFAARYPEHAEELSRLLELVVDMERGAGPDRTVRMDESSAPRTGAILPDDPGDVDIPDFRLVRKLGAGGMGTVFEAVQISLDRRVAVKLLSPALFSDAVQREQFENEARVIAMLHHPNIVKVLSAGHCADRCYYAMELIDGKGLDNLKITDPREIARIGLQAARALAYAHRCGVMHRDIKPGNLLIDRDRELHICDFGIASVLKSEGGIVEKRGMRSGTVRYMAPERLADGINTFSCDQYSLGATLYELVTGAPLFAERTRRELIQRICSAPVPPLKCAESDLAAIINKSISYHAERRYADMDDMAADLEHYLRHEPVMAASPSPWRKFVLWARRKPAVAALTLALVLCVALLFGATAAGLVRTRAALKRAERNAAVADATLSQVFDRMAELPPTPKNTELLSSLLPYYRTIAGERNLPAEKIRAANLILGRVALRCGDYPVAEQAYRAILRSGGEDAAAMNHLATALARQGRRDEARELSGQVAERFADSAVPGERFEAARALLTLADAPDSAERTRAFGILEKLLADRPDDPEYRFQYALLLAGNPRLFRDLRIPGVKPNAVMLLADLAAAHPERPEYGVALVDLMKKTLRLRRGRDRRRREGLATALELSERLLGRWPNDPTVIAAVTEFHREYIEVLRDDGETAQAAKVAGRWQNIMEILFHTPEVPDAVREELIAAQLEKLEDILKAEHAAAGSMLAGKIARELEVYRGPRQREFKEKLDRFKASPAAGDDPAPERPRRGMRGMRGPRRRSSEGTGENRERRER